MLLPHYNNNLLDAFTFSHPSPSPNGRFMACLKSALNRESVGECVMFKENSGKLMIYASSCAPHRKRLESVRTATQQTAKRLNLNFEMVKLIGASTSIYVYYEDDGDDEPIPLYCDEGKMSGLEEISSKLRSMMFVLSFHPKHAALRQMRKEILKLS